nr:MAG TPA: histocompatibility antigen [Caudoviricetes sp.]
MSAYTLQAYRGLHTMQLLVSCQLRDYGLRYLF